MPGSAGLAPEHPWSLGCILFSSARRSLLGCDRLVPVWPALAWVVGTGGAAPLPHAREPGAPFRKAGDKPGRAVPPGESKGTPFLVVLSRHAVRPAAWPPWAHGRCRGSFCGPRPSWLICVHSGTYGSTEASAVTS